VPAGGADVIAAIAGVLAVGILVVVLLVVARYRRAPGGTGP
jgi:hypothetical protein